MAVKTAEPDGYTVLLITTSTHAANVSLVRNLSYDPAKDFTVVGVFRSSGSYLMVPPQGFSDMRYVQGVGLRGRQIAE